MEHINDGLREAVRQMRLFPVLCASALHNVASDLALDFVTENFPNPADRGPWSGQLNGSPATRAVKDLREPASVFVFKTIADARGTRVRLQGGFRDPEERLP